MKLGSYHMQHRAPGREEGAPLHDVTANGVYPSDFRRAPDAWETRSLSYDLPGRSKGHPDHQPG
jgi:hypothetical protein